ncbi:MAG: sigma factor [Planctomycetaceae bacterium]
MAEVTHIGCGLPALESCGSLNTPAKRLSEIDTSWTELGLARGSRAEAPDAVEARKSLLHRYAGPVYQYLLGCVRDENVADDLAQDFAVRFLAGRFESADRDRGRFRDFLKRSLSNLATDHFRKQAVEKKSLEKLAVQPQVVTEDHPAFDDLWRDEILKRTWDALRLSQDQLNSSMYVVLRHRAEFPDQSTAEMATAFAGLLTRDEITEPWVRQTLHRARRKFGKLLREEVARTVGSCEIAVIDEELAELGLLQYCD